MGVACSSSHCINSYASIQCLTAPAHICPQTLTTIRLPLHVLHSKISNTHNTDHDQICGSLLLPLSTASFHVTCFKCLVYLVVWCSKGLHTLIHLNTHQEYTHTTLHVHAHICCTILKACRPYRPNTHTCAHTLHVYHTHTHMTLLDIKILFIGCILHTHILHYTPGL